MLEQLYHTTVSVALYMGLSKTQICMYMPSENISSDIQCLAACSRLACTTQYIELKWTIAMRSSKHNITLRYSPTRITMIA